MSDWKTIESAPKDGTWFMICRADEGFDSYEIGAYDPLVSSEYEHVGNGLFRRSETIAYEWRGFNNFHRATHWMPLPEAPTS